MEWYNWVLLVGGSVGILAGTWLYCQRSKIGIGFHKWEIIRCIWPYPDGYCWHCVKCGTSIDHGCNKRQLIAQGEPHKGDGKSCILEIHYD